MLANLRAELGIERVSGGIESERFRQLVVEALHVERLDPALLLLVLGWKDFDERPALVGPFLADVEAQPVDREVTVRAARLALRAGLVDRARAGVAHARDNTQTAWLDRRAAWTWEILEQATRRSENA